MNRENSELVQPRALPERALPVSVRLVPPRESVPRAPLVLVSLASLPLGTTGFRLPPVLPERRRPAVASRRQLAPPLRPERVARRLGWALELAVARPTARAAKRSARRVPRV